MGFFIILGIIAFILYVAMMSMMIILERDKPKNIIIWSIIFLVTQIIGYIIYLFIRNVFYKKRNSIVEKQREDEIYAKLIANSLCDNKTDFSHEVFNFNNLAYNTKTTANNTYKVITDYEDFKELLINDIKKSKKYILLELTKINHKDFSLIKDALIERAKADVMIRLSYDRNINKKLIKELKLSGIKVYRFSKYNTVGKVYSNLRNTIVIDGETAYIANLNVTNAQLKTEKEVSCAFIRMKGDIVQDIDVEIHKDAIFASGKFIPFEKADNNEIKNNSIIQYVTNKIETDLELALIKAICMAKRTIQLHLNQFIPTESIMSLLRFAINSNIDVKLMVPLKSDRQGKYFASRAYAKELALFGANVYLFDGYIKFNAITIDDDYVIYGSFIVDREHLNTSQQNMLFIKDKKIVEIFNQTFNANIENSYRINNAKFMLLREKFFKNFV